jgi:hypothetical protein
LKHVQFSECNYIERQTKIEKMKEKKHFKYILGDEERVGKRITYIML